MYECDFAAGFDDTNLPSGLCDEIQNEVALCQMNIATGWAVGGELVRSFDADALSTTTVLLPITDHGISLRSRLSDRCELLDQVLLAADALQQSTHVHG